MSVGRNGMKIKPRLSREKLLQSIVRDRSLLNAYFQDLATKDTQTGTQPESSPITAIKTAPVQHRDSYDLFFESACISIKSLPPKLAAEAKSRISQIITEFELRAITEQEAQQEKEKQQIAKTIRVPIDSTVDSASGIVYEFQPYT